MEATARGPSDGVRCGAVGHRGQKSKMLLVFSLTENNVISFSQTRRHPSAEGLK